MTDQTTDHLSEAHAAALAAFQQEDKRLAPGGGALDSELVAAAVDAARPHLATYYEDKGREAAEAELERYRTVFGALCWECGGSGDEPGAFDDDTSGGLKVCGACNGKGTK